jgi:hypothetical protein
MKVGTGISQIQHDQSLQSYQKIDKSKEYILADTLPTISAVKDTKLIENNELNEYEANVRRIS